MMKKVLPMMVLGMAAQDYYNKSGKKKDKEIVKEPSFNKDQMKEDMRKEAKKARKKK